MLRVIRIVELVVQVHRPDAVHDQAVADAVEGAEDHDVADAIALAFCGYKNTLIAKPNVINLDSALTSSR